MIELLIRGPWLVAFFAFFIFSVHCNDVYVVGSTTATGNKKACLTSALAAPDNKPKKIDFAFGDVFKVSSADGDSSSGGSLDVFIDTRNAFMCGVESGSASGVGEPLKIGTATLPAADELADVKVGGAYALLRSKAGKVFCVGTFSGGECGSASTSKRDLVAFGYASMPSKVVDMAAGVGISFLVGDTGQLIAFGTANTAGSCNGGAAPGAGAVIRTSGVLGVAHTAGVSLTPGTLFWTNSGEVYACGSNKYNNLGLGNTALSPPSPSRVSGGDFSGVTAVHQVSMSRFYTLAVVTSGTKRAAYIGGTTPAGSTPSTMAAPIFQLQDDAMGCPTPTAKVATSPTFVETASCGMGNPFPPLNLALANTLVAGGAIAAAYGTDSDFGSYNYVVSFGACDVFPKRSCDPSGPVANIVSWRPPLDLLRFDGLIKADDVAIHGSGGTGYLLIIVKAAVPTVTATPPYLPRTVTATPPYLPRTDTLTATLRTTATLTPDTSGTSTDTPSFPATATASYAPSGSVSATGTVTPRPTTTRIRSESPTRSSTVTPSRTPTPIPTREKTPTPRRTATHSTTASPTISRTATRTVTITPTTSATPTQSSTATATASITPGSSVSVSSSESVSVSPTSTSTRPASVSVSVSSSPSATRTPSPPPPSEIKITSRHPLTACNFTAHEINNCWSICAFKFEEYTKAMEVACAAIDRPSTMRTRHIWKQAPRPSAANATNNPATGPWSVMDCSAASAPYWRLTDCVFKTLAEAGPLFVNGCTAPRDNGVDITCAIPVATDTPSPSDTETYTSPITASPTDTKSYTSIPTTTMSSATPPATVTFTPVPTATIPPRKPFDPVPTVTWPPFPVEPPLHCFRPELSLFHRLSEPAVATVLASTYLLGVFAVPGAYIGGLPLAVALSECNAMSCYEVGNSGYETAADSVKIASSAPSDPVSAASEEALVHSIILFAATVVTMGLLCALLSRTLPLYPLAREDTISSPSAPVRATIPAPLTPSQGVANVFASFMRAPGRRIGSIAAIFTPVLLASAASAVSCGRRIDSPLFLVGAAMLLVAGLCPLVAIAAVIVAIKRSSSQIPLAPLKSGSMAVSEALQYRDPASISSSAWVDKQSSYPALSCSSLLSEPTRWFSGIIGPYTSTGTVFVMTTWILDTATSVLLGLSCQKCCDVHSIATVLLFLRLGGVAAARAHASVRALVVDVCFTLAALTGCLSRTILSCGGPGSVATSRMASAVMVMVLGTGAIGFAIFAIVKHYQRLNGAFESLAAYRATASSQSAGPGAPFGDTVYDLAAGGTPGIYPFLAVLHEQGLRDKVYKDAFDAPDASDDAEGLRFAEGGKTHFARAYTLRDGSVLRYAARDEPPLALAWSMQDYHAIPQINGFLSPPRPAAPLLPKETSFVGPPTRSLSPPPKKRKKPPPKPYPAVRYASLKEANKPPGPFHIHSAVLPDEVIEPASVSQAHRVAPISPTSPLPSPMMTPSRNTDMYQFLGNKRLSEGPKRSPRRNWAIRFDDSVSPSPSPTRPRPLQAPVSQANSFLE